MSISQLQEERLQYQPKLPESLANGINNLEIVEGAPTTSVKDCEAINDLFKILEMIMDNVPAKEAIKYLKKYY